MRIVAETVGGRLLLLEVDAELGRVLDTVDAVLGPPERLGDLRASATWLDYRGPQNLGLRLRDASETDRRRFFLTGAAVDMTHAAEAML